jgi:aryl-alcohol dehydrogenase-like predicted oxidoreductase
MISIANKRPRLVLGTVQLGLRYGVANRTGLPDEAEAIQILRTAIASGVDTIDTARAYGDAERRIGVALPAPSPVEIVTKLDPLEHIPTEASPDEAVAAARRSLAASRAALGRDRLDVLLLHRSGHRTAWQGAVWRFLKSERDETRIGRLGVSVQNPEEAHAALADPDVSQLQLPFNLLDRRWQDAGVIDSLTKRGDVTVHVRSVLLQGLLANAPHAEWPRLRGISFDRLKDWLRQTAGEFGREDTADLAIAFVREQKWIDGIVIGCETIDQLTHNLELFRRHALSEEALTAVAKSRPEVSTDLLDPASWPKTS